MVSKPGDMRRWTLPQSHHFTWRTRLLQVPRPLQQLLGLPRPLQPRHPIRRKPRKQLPPQGKTIIMRWMSPLRWQLKTWSVTMQTFHCLSRIRLSRSKYRKWTGCIARKPLRIAGDLVQAATRKMKMKKMLVRGLNPRRGCSSKVRPVIARRAKPMLLLPQPSSRRRWVAARHQMSWPLLLQQLLARGKPQHTDGGQTWMRHRP
mmetsp:Transcript_789/g.1693  ORF Transcript_789/g.1693 Transcript_789/m.1693 type:complete len:204 (+) Transcript_789:714-1325(+)